MFPSVTRTSPTSSAAPRAALRSRQGSRDDERAVWDRNDQLIGTVSVEVTHDLEA